MNTLYTAVGKFEQRNDGGNRYPVIIVQGGDHRVDIQEMILWSCLSWRFWSLPQLKLGYEQKAHETDLLMGRSFEQCVTRLLQRGLIASGAGATGEEALYDLLNSLYLIPTCCGLFTKTFSFLKLTICDGLPFRVTRNVFHKEPMTEEERRVIGLARQTLLSTAEIIKCVDRGAYDISSNSKVMETLYDDDDTTCDNIGSLARCFGCRVPVVQAIANLYLHKQLIFERI